VVTRPRELEGPANFRDLGGYRTADGRRVRRGRLFRSDSLFRLTEADAWRLRELGMVTAIDFRSPFEVGRTGAGGLARVDVRYHHLPTIDRTKPPGRTRLGLFTSSASDAYLGMLDVGRNSFASALRIIADPAAQPAVFFCTAGKDRTGCFAAFVLGLLGVSEHEIVDDYARTMDTIGEILAMSTAEISELGSIFSALSEDLRSAFPETMVETLRGMRERWGTWEDYASEIGVAPGVIEALRSELVE
jgi:protein-tyrosine phosphatase